MLWPFHSFSCVIFHSIHKIENCLAHSHSRLMHLNNWSLVGGTVRGVYRTFKAMKPCCGLRHRELPGEGATSSLYLQFVLVVSRV